MISEKVVTLVALIHLGRALASRNTDGAGYISFPLTGRTGPSLVGNLAKRQQEMIATSRLNGTLYTIDITLGSPGQTVPVQFDTDAAELWVNSVCMNSSDPEFCGEQPRFTESSTLNILDIAGRAEYKLGWANFQYVVDYVRIGCRFSTDRYYPLRANNTTPCASCMLTTFHTSCTCLLADIWSCLPE